MPHKLGVLAEQWFSISWTVILVKEVTKGENNTWEYQLFHPKYDLEGCVLGSHLLFPEIYNINYY